MAFGREKKAMQSQNDVKWRWIRAVWAFNYSSFVANWMDFRYFWVKIKTPWRSSRVILSEMAAYTFIIRNQFRKIVKICESWIFWLKSLHCSFVDDLGNKSCLTDG